jgi:uncharacterized protein involved in exopolysaccharide biosynthesis
MAPVETETIIPDYLPPEPLLPSMFDTLLALARRKWLIFGMAAAGAIIAAVVALLVPPQYTGTALIMPPAQQQSTAASLLGQLGPIAGLAGHDLGIKNPNDLYIGILQGRTIADELVRKFDLQKLYDVDTMMEARKRLAELSSISSGKDSLIKISVDDRDPQRAAALANAYVDQLYKQTNRLALTESAQRRLFFERQLTAERAALADAEAALKATQQRTGVLQVSAQVEAVIRSIAQMRAEIAGREVSLQSLRSGATERNPEVVRQESELAALRGQLQKLESSAGARQTGDPAIPAAQVPQVGLEYMRALRELKYHETLFELLSKQYEVARIDEAKEAPVIQVLDTALPPEKKSWPPRALFILGGAIFCGLAGCGIALTLQRLQNPAEKEKWGALKLAFRGR